MTTWLDHLAEQVKSLSQRVRRPSALDFHHTHRDEDGCSLDVRRIQR